MRFTQCRLGFQFGFLTTLMICADPLNAQVIEAESAQEKLKPQLAHVYQKAHILCNRDTHTVVPLQSIIYQPRKNKEKVTDTPSGKFRFWPDFLPRNRDWLLTFEVTLDQAKGNKPIPDNKLKEFAKISRTVIATYRRNPISVRPYVKPSETDTKK